MELSDKFAFVKSITPLQILVAVLPFITGMFYEWQTALLTIALAVILVLEMIKRKKDADAVLTKSKNKKNRYKAATTEIEIGLPFIFAAVVVLFHIFAMIWAVDRGMALMGVVKYLPLPMFVLAANRGDDVLKLIPVSGVLMTIVSVALSGIDIFKGHLIVSGRIGGFFEYPNTYAMFLLVCLIIVLFKEKIRVVDWVFAAVFGAGIALSGSRTVLVLTALTGIVFIIWVKDKKIKFICLAAFVLAAVGAGVFLSHKLTSLTNFSTFYGRFLYFADALPVILKHPLGLGYYGYYYTQGSFQSGVYSIVHIHNDLLQILLDIGWIPALLGIFMAVKAFIKAEFKYKLMMIMLVLHMLFDFDMQFISMSVIFLAIAMKSSGTRKIELSPKAALASQSVISLALAGFAGYLGMASFFNYINDFETAVRIYPMYTEAQKMLLVNAQTDDEMNRIADSILSHNPNYALANSAKARVAFSSGDIVSMIDYKDKAIRANRYSLEEYLDYISMLEYSISMYVQIEDYQSAEYCIDTCLSTVKYMNSVKSGTSKLGYMIDDKPQLDLPAEYQDYIRTLENLKSV